MDDVLFHGRSGPEPALIVDVDGFEGPLDLLLELARRQKVDLKHISILALVEQYLLFIETAHQLRLELAADYLVMAAWLAYLKSRLLLPIAAPSEEPDAGDLAATLALRLQRLEDIRRVSLKLSQRPQVGRDVFVRGNPEEMAIVSRPKWDATLYELLSAYTMNRQRRVNARVVLRKRIVWSLAEAREALQRLVGHAVDWVSLDAYLESYMAAPEMRATVRASALSAMLEMVREGKIDLVQEAPFAPLMMRCRGTKPFESVSEVA